MPAGKYVIISTTKFIKIHFLRTSAHEPSNPAGSVTGTNFVVCSHGKYLPSQQS